MPLASPALSAAKEAAVIGFDVQSLKCTFEHSGERLIATAGAWFCNDIFFYGNKLFSPIFIAALSPGNKSVLTGWLWNLVNAGVSLCGYYLASFLIDTKFVVVNKCNNSASSWTLSYSWCRLSITLLQL
jgi:hypothetical protein